MMLIRRLISLFLFLILANVFVQARDSLVVKLDNQSVFKGYLLNQDNDSLYVGTLYDTDFRQYTGLWYKDGKNVFTLSFSGDSILLSNQESIGINRMECYSPDRYNVSFGYGGTDSKYYDYKDGYWYTVDFGCKRYNKDSSILETVDDAVFMPIFHFLLVSFVLFLLLLPITGDDKEWLPTGYSLILSVLLIILYYVFTTEYIRLQLVGPMMTFSLLYLLRFFVSGLKYIIAHLVLAGIMLTFWSYFLFFNLEQVVCMSDSTPVNVKWQPGTSVFKRHIVKKTIANLLPVKVRDHDTDYVVYVSKYELSREEFDVINDELFALIGYLLREEPLYDFSYREARIVLKRFKEISNVDFDFLSYNEWKSAALGKTHEVCKSITEMSDVDEGNSNEYGLVNLTSNLPEYTTSYFKTSRLGMSADTLLSEYNHVIVAGDAYTSDYALECSVVDKDLREGHVGFRLIYRPKNIGARKFFIMGVAADGAAAEYPQNIILESYNGVSVLEMSDYESFQELVVEERFNAKKLIVNDISINQRIELEIPTGKEMYDFVPLFVFEGVDN